MVNVEVLERNMLESRFLVLRSGLFLEFTTNICYDKLQYPRLVYLTCFAILCSVAF